MHKPPSNLRPKSSLRHFLRSPGKSFLIEYLTLDSGFGQISIIVPKPAYLQGRTSSPASLPRHSRFPHIQPRSSSNKQSSKPRDWRLLTVSGEPYFVFSILLFCILDLTASASDSNTRADGSTSQASILSLDRPTRSQPSDRSASQHRFSKPTPVFFSTTPSILSDLLRSATRTRCRPRGLWACP